MTVAMSAFEAAPWVLIGLLFLVFGLVCLFVHLTNPRRDHRRKDDQE
jgi:hypothetical protein